MGQYVLIDTVNGIHKYPLHNIYLKSELINDMVTVATFARLPFSGVHLLSFNDLAGYKVRVPSI